MRTIRFGLLGVLALPLGCAAWPRDFGRLDPEVVAFARSIDTSRGFELALDDDARIVGYAGAVTTAELPGLAREVALGLAQNAVVRGGSRIVELRHETWEVELEHDGKRTAVRVRFDDEGVPHVVQTRRRAKPDEVPAAVLERAKSESGEGSIDAIELVEADASVVYHVTKTVGRETLRLAIQRDGTLVESLRLVRCGLGLVDASNPS